MYFTLEVIPMGETGMGSSDILVVEDNPDDLELTLRVLKKAQISGRIDVARDGAEALDLLFGTGPHEGRGVAHYAVVLMDINMPRVDGLEVLRRVREDERTRHQPVVILTSSDEQEDIVRSYNLSVNSYMRKPVEFSQFSEAVSRVGSYSLIMNMAPDRE